MSIPALQTVLQEVLPTKYERRIVVFIPYVNVTHITVITWRMERLVMDQHSSKASPFYMKWYNVKFK